MCPSSAAPVFRGPSRSAQQQLLGQRACRCAVGTLTAMPTEGLMQGYTCALTVRPVYHGIDRRCFRQLLRWNAGQKNVFAMLHLRHESASVAKPDPPRTAPKGRNIGSRQAASVDDVTGSCQQQPSPRGVRSAPAPMQAGVPRNVARATP